MKFHHQINGSGQMVKCSDLSNLNLEDGYSIVPQVHESWREAEQRLLVLVESVDSLDLFRGELLSGSTVDPGRQRGKERSNHNPMRSVLSNILDLAVTHLKSYGVDPGEFSFGIANYNCKRIRNLEPSRQAGAFPSFTRRAVKIIRKLKPTHVLVCGDTAAHFLLESLEADEDDPRTPEACAENSLYKRGWVFKRKIGNHRFLLTPTLDLESLYNPPNDGSDDEDGGDDDQDNDRYAAADLLFFVTRNLANLLNGAMLHDLSRIKPNPIYVDTVEKFDKFFAKLLATKNKIGVDTETRALTNTSNAIYMAQFALSVDAAYVIPVRHPKSPFTSDESDYIEGRLHWFLKSKKYRKVLATLNGTFDTRIFRTQLGLDIIPYHQIHEVTAGEQLLDENIGLFARLKFYYAGEYHKTSYQNLRALCCLYGNDWYWTAVFSKNERSLVGSRPPDDPDVLAYASMDAQVTLALALEQGKIADNQVILPSLNAKRVRYHDLFERHLLNQMSNTVQSISHMEQTGSPLDMKYLLHLLGPSSPLHALIKETTAELVRMPNVIETSRRLLNKAGKATGSLFGDDVSMNVFTVGKKEHKEALVFEVMKLPVVNLTATGRPAIGKVFMAAYREKHKEVALLETISKTAHMMSTYIKGWVRILQTNLDSSLDSALRASFGFFTIVTGRLNSFKPSLQNAPSHGELAKRIKRAFVPPEGHLNVKYDYSAHEVRCWSYVAYDKANAASFQAGLDLRRRLIQAASIPEPAAGWKAASIESLDKEASELDSTTKRGKLGLAIIGAQRLLLEIKADLKKKGDSHIQNVFRFFGRWVEKSDPLREAIKKIVFGLIYGKGVRSIANDTGRSKEDIEEIIQKLFEGFPEGSRWLEEAAEQVSRYAHVVSPIGRVRRLWRVYTGARGVIAAAQRRAQNAPIQGFASEIGATSGFLILLACYEFIRERGLDMETNMPKLCRMVHDSSFSIVPFQFVLPFIHICQYTATVGVKNWYLETFDVELTIEPEIELELCASEDKSYKWNWELPSLVRDVYQTIKDLVPLGRLPEDQIDAVYETVMAPWKDAEYRGVLQDRFPLLNVKELDAQIVFAINDLKRSSKKESA